MDCSLPTDFLFYFIMLVAALSAVTFYAAHKAADYDHLFDSSPFLKDGIDAVYLRNEEKHKNEEE